MTESATGSATGSAGIPTVGGTDEDWAALVAVALLGTARKPVPELRPGPLAKVAELTEVAPDSATPEAVLLDRAAVLTGYRRGGFRPPVLTAPATEVAPPETVPVVSAAAGVRLAELIAASGREARALLTEWLGLAAAHGVRVPARLLPELLRVAAGDPALGRHLRAVVGERGPWLAAQLPEWSALFADPTPARPETTRASEWDLGDDHRRRRWLRAARRADPDRARELLQQAWPREPAGQRAALLTELQVGLGPADEGFLEQALDDRSRDVRAAAVRLLDRLTGSARATRMTPRALALVRRRQPGRRRIGWGRRVVDPDGPEVLIDPPPEPDAAAIRDGLAVPGNSRSAARGSSAARLEAIIAATPLDVWPERLGLSPAQLVGATTTAEWSAHWRAGLARAARSQDRLDWARALLDHRADHLDERDDPESVLGGPLSAGSVGAESVLLAMVPEAERAERVARVLPGAGVEARELLAGCPAPWPEVLTAAVLRRLRIADPIPLPTVGLRELIGLRADPTSASLTELIRSALTQPRSGPHPGPAGQSSTRDGPAPLDRDSLRFLGQLAPLIAYRIAMHEEFS